MSRSRDFIVTGPDSRRACLSFLGGLDLGRFPLGLAVRVSVRQPDITDAQRKRLCAMTDDVAAQVEFPGGGYASGASWRRFLVALHRGEHRMERDGNVVVVVNGSIAGATRQEASDLIAFISAWGAERGVVFSEED